MALEPLQILPDAQWYGCCSACAHSASVLLQCLAKHDGITAHSILLDVSVLCVVSA